MASMEENIALLQQYIDESHTIVFFGGAGVSTESGIPDFRSVDGLYHMNYQYPPEQIISHSFFQANPDEFYRFYKDKMLITDAKPNIAHLRLAELEAAGRLKAVVTQNIDGLHTAAGSKCVYEVHGSVLRNYCMKCHKFFDVNYVKEADGIPHCDACGGMVKPDVVLYEEGLDNQVVTGALTAIQQADLLIVAGTSLVVYPAAGFLNYFNGNHMVLINKDPTPADAKADLVIHAKIGEVFSQIKVPNE